MPMTPITREPLPYVRPAYEPDTRTLRELLALAGQSRAQHLGRKGQNRAEGLYTLGQIISQGLRGIREGGEREQAMRAQAERQAREDAFKQRDQQLREADVIARMQEREDARNERMQADAYKRGGAVAEEVGYGPMSEMQLNDVMQGPAAGRARYSFGPGTAEGPELQPTREQQRALETERQIKAMGGTLGPNGQVVMPPKPEPAFTPESRLSGEDLLAYLASQGNQGAAKALEIKRRQQAAATRQSSSSGSLPRQLTQNAESALVNRWAREWQTVTKPEREIGRQIVMMDAGLEAAKRGDMAQASEAILQTFLKVLDPNSVVREGEFWRLHQGQSLINRIKAAVQRVPKGGWVTLPELEKYAQLAKEIQAGLSASTSGQRQRIAASADRYGIPHELIFDVIPEDNQSKPSGKSYLSNDPNAGEAIATPNRRRP